MPGDIRKRTLLVVSDTAMYNRDGQLLVFDPVLRELNAIDDMFDEIIWLGARALKKKRSLKPLNNDKIKAEMLPCLSRSGKINVLYILLAYPVIFLRIIKYLKHATHVHTRAPAHPAWIMIVLSYFDNKRIYAHKYAGEWTEKNIPFTYRAQRSLLKRVRKPNIKVVISGKNDEESVNVHDMENPCIYEHEIAAMNSKGLEKNYNADLKLLFVGNLMPTKGILELMSALQSGKLDRRYKEITIVGGGMLMDKVQQAAKKVLHININIVGDISREELNEHYAAAHILILPSSSESFPKVVAEASAFGCIPVTTPLSAITKKVMDGTNGFLMENNEPVNILSTLNRVALNDNLAVISGHAISMSKLFTYERFRQRMGRIYEINE